MFSTGRAYKYRCKGCGFYHEYFVGGGFFSEDYYDESEKLENELKSDILAGKYGDILKAAVEADTTGKLRFFCDTDLFQCRKCKEIKIWREKRIVLAYDTNNKYDLDIEIKQICPNCGCEDFDRIKHYKPLCPDCKKEHLKLVTISMWD